MTIINLENFYQRFLKYEFEVNSEQFCTIKKEQKMFKLHSKFEPTGDQPQAIKSLVDGIQKGEKYQTLLGVTGSRKDIYNGKYN